MIDRDKHHPSIILWSIGNEEWALEWNVYSPAGTWYDYYTGELVSNGNETLIVPAPYDHSPIFLKNKQSL